jgi:myo-inositol 2-dehydrogenase / D-chiro-inositol 1-dehydrogenase
VPWTAGEVGTPEIVTISSRDPGAPPAEYIKVSGGLFRDMTIHDFDMARWLLGEEPVTRLRQRRSAYRFRKIGELGDVDTAVVTLTCARRPHGGDHQQPAGNLRL